MRYETAGESHGRALTALITGVPAGLPVDMARIDADLARRQRGYGRGGRQKIEQDRAVALAGIRGGRALGSPIALTVANRDWENWTDIMSPGEVTPGQEVTAVRPGHADLPGCLKTKATDARDILERASARETAARVAAGGVAKALLAAVGVTVRSLVTRIGDVEMPEPDVACVDYDAVEASDVRCPDEQVAQRMREAIDAARTQGESLGGVFVVYATGLVPGLGGYARAADRLDGRLAGAIASIPAIKGVEFGEGFALAERPGSQAHDEIHYETGRGFHRPTNRAGGLEGGMTNGEILVVRAAMKPIPTLMRPLRTVDLATREEADASRERSDVVAVPAAAVVAEAEVAFVLADAYCEKFGADCIDDLLGALDAYEERIS